MAQRTLGVVDDAIVSCCNPLVQEALSDEEAHAMALIYSALADPVRLRLLSLVASVEEVPPHEDP
jgi:ArsR family transcriptional regulator